MFKRLHTIIVSWVLMSFVFSSVQVPAFAQIDPLPFMPAPGTMVSLSPEYTPAYLKGIVIHPENALKFDFIIYKGDKPLTEAQKREEYTKLTKYFLASLAIPDDDQWVNLSPYEKDRIIKDDFGKTEMGRDLLAQDYLLKQITASLIYPEDNLGKKFWDKVYTQAQKQYGTTNIPVNTFNKVWILPDDALIYEKGNTAYVLKNHLRVMLEEDYLSLQKHSGISTVIPGSSYVIPAKAGIHSIAFKIIKEIVLPELQREVNEDANFAPLRQVYSGMLLATWFKRTLKQSLLGQIYANKGKVRGVDQDPRNNEEIYQQYLQAYKKGVFNFIKEDADRFTNETMPRKYFSGGDVSYAMASEFTGQDVLKITRDSAMGERAERQAVSNLDVADFAMTEDKAMMNSFSADRIFQRIKKNQERDQEVAREIGVKLGFYHQLFYYTLLEAAGLNDEDAHKIGLDKLYLLWHQSWSIADDIVAKFGKLLTPQDWKGILQRSRDYGELPFIPEGLLKAKGVSEDDMEDIPASNLFEGDHRNRLTIVREAQGRMELILHSLNVPVNTREAILNASSESTRRIYASFAREEVIGLYPNLDDVRKYMRMKTTDFMVILTRRLHEVFHTNVDIETNARLMGLCMYLLQVMDDFGDFEEDYKIQPNIFLAMLHQHPDEFRNIEERLGQSNAKVKESELAVLAPETTKDINHEINTAYNALHEINPAFAQIFKSLLDEKYNAVRSDAAMNAVTKSITRRRMFRAGLGGLGVALAAASPIIYDALSNNDKVVEKKVELDDPERKEVLDFLERAKRDPVIAQTKPFFDAVDVFEKAAREELIDEYSPPSSGVLIGFGKSQLLDNGEYKRSAGINFRFIKSLLEKARQGEPFYEKLAFSIPVMLGTSILDREDKNRQIFYQNMNELGNSEGLTDTGYKVLAAMSIELQLVGRRAAIDYLVESNKGDDPKKKFFELAGKANNDKRLKTYLMAWHRIMSSVEYGDKQTRDLRLRVTMYVHNTTSEIFAPLKKEIDRIVEEEDGKGAMNRIYNFEYLTKPDPFILYPLSFLNDSAYYDYPPKRHSALSIQDNTRDSAMRTTITLGIRRYKKEDVQKVIDYLPRIIASATRQLERLGDNHTETFVFPLRDDIKTIENTWQAVLNEMPNLITTARQGYRMRYDQVQDLQRWLVDPENPVIKQMNQNSRETQQKPAKPQRRKIAYLLSPMEAGAGGFEKGDMVGILYQNSLGDVILASGYFGSIKASYLTAQLAGDQGSTDFHLQEQGFPRLLGIRRIQKDEFSEAPIGLGSGFGSIRTNSLMVAKYTIGQKLRIIYQDKDEQIKVATGVLKRWGSNSMSLEIEGNPKPQNFNFYHLPLLVGVEVREERQEKVTAEARQYIEAWIRTLLYLETITMKDQKEWLARFLGIDPDNDDFRKAFQRLYTNRKRGNEDLTEKAISDLIAVSSEPDVILNQQVKIANQIFPKKFAYEALQELLRTIRYKRPAAGYVDEKYRGIIAAMNTHGRHEQLEGYRFGFYIKPDVYDGKIFIQTTGKYDGLSDIIGLDYFRLKLFSGQLDAAMTVDEAKKILKGKRILFVDDDVSQREEYKDAFERLGVIFKEAENGAEALKLLESGEEFDFVLSDLQMPVMGGEELARRIRQSGKNYANVKMFIRTGTLIEGEEEIAKGSGVKKISKVMDLNKLRIAIATEVDAAMTQQDAAMTGKRKAEPMSADDFIGLDYEKQLAALQEMDHSELVRLLSDLLHDDAVPDYVLSRVYTELDKKKPKNLITIRKFDAAMRGEDLFNHSLTRARELMAENNFVGAREILNALETYEGEESRRMLETFGILTREYFAGLLNSAKRDLRQRDLIMQAKSKLDELEGLIRTHVLPPVSGTQLRQFRRSYFTTEASRIRGARNLLLLGSQTLDDLDEPAIRRAAMQADAKAASDRKVGIARARDFLLWLKSRDEAMINDNAFIDLTSHENRLISMLNLGLFILKELDLNTEEFKNLDAPTVVKVLKDSEETKRRHGMPSWELGIYDDWDFRIATASYLIFGERLTEDEFIGRLEAKREDEEIQYYIKNVYTAVSVIYELFRRGQFYFKDLVEAYEQRLIDRRIESHIPVGDIKNKEFLSRVLEVVEGTRADGAMRGDDKRGPQNYSPQDSDAEESRILTNITSISQVHVGNDPPGLIGAVVSLHRSLYLQSKLTTDGAISFEDYWKGYQELFGPGARDTGLNPRFGIIGEYEPHNAAHIWFNALIQGGILLSRHEPLEESDECPLSDLGYVFLAISNTREWMISHRHYVLIDLLDLFHESLKKLVIGLSNQRQQGQATTLTKYMEEWTEGLRWLIAELENSPKYDEAVSMLKPALEKLDAAMGAEEVGKIVKGFMDKNGAAGRYTFNTRNDGVGVIVSITQEKPDSGETYNLIDDLVEDATTARFSFWTRLFPGAVITGVKQEHPNVFEFRVSWLTLVHDRGRNPAMIGQDAAMGAEPQERKEGPGIIRLTHQTSILNVEKILKHGFYNMIHYKTFLVGNMVYPVGNDDEDVTLVFNIPEHLVVKDDRYTDAYSLSVASKVDESEVKEIMGGDWINRLKSFRGYSKDIEFGHISSSLIDIPATIAFNQRLAEGGMLNKSVFEQLEGLLKSAAMKAPRGEGEGADGVMNIEEPLLVTMQALEISKEGNKDRAMLDGLSWEEIVLTAVVVGVGGIGYTLKILYLNNLQKIQTELVRILRESNMEDVLSYLNRKARGNELYHLEFIKDLLVMKNPHFQEPGSDEYAKDIGIQEYDPLLIAGLIRIYPKFADDKETKTSIEELEALTEAAKQVGETGAAMTEGVGGTESTIKDGAMNAPTIEELLSPAGPAHLGQYFRLAQTSGALEEATQTILAISKQYLRESPVGEREWRRKYNELIDLFSFEKRAIFQGRYDKAIDEQLTLIWHNLVVFELNEIRKAEIARTQRDEMDPTFLRPEDDPYFGYKGIKKPTPNLTDRRMLTIYGIAAVALAILMKKGKDDKAMRGGIDLNASNLHLVIKRDGHGVPLPLAQQDLAQLSNIQGLDPIILSIKPASQTEVFSQLVAQP